MQYTRLGTEISLAWLPFQQFMLALISASDALMLGMLTQDSLSAVSLASQVTFVENL